MTIDPSLPGSNRTLVAALAMSGHVSEAHEALKRYLALPNSDLRTIAAVKAFNARFVNERTDQRVIDVLDRRIEGYRKAGMPET